MKKQLLIIKVFSLIVFGIFFSSCQNEMDSELDDSPTTLAQEGENFKFYTDVNLYSKLQANRGAASTDVFAIKEVRKRNDRLSVTVTYSGGCQDHAFDFVWDGVVNMSNPGKVNLLLRHEGNGDRCKALITKTFELDLNKYFNNLVDPESTVINVANTSILQTVNSQGQVFNK